MDSEAIKAYSGVIADAAEDSEPEHPVIYTQQSGDLNQAPRAEHAPMNHWAYWRISQIFHLIFSQYLREIAKFLNE